MQATTVRPRVTVTADGRGVGSHAGARLLTDLADAAGLSAVFCDALAGLRERRGGHDPGRVLVDLAVLRDQPGLFGMVASTATAGTTSHASAQSPWWAVASGLGNPRHLTLSATATCTSWRPAEGSVSCAVHPECGEFCLGFAGAVTKARDDDGPDDQVLTGLPSRVS